MHDISPETLAKLNTYGRNAIDVSSKETLLRSMESSLWKVNLAKGVTSYYLNFLDFRPDGVVLNHRGTGPWQVVDAHTLELNLKFFSEPEKILIEVSSDGTKITG